MSIGSTTSNSISVCSPSAKSSSSTPRGMEKVELGPGRRQLKVKDSDIVGLPPFNNGGSKGESSQVGASQASRSVVKSLVASTMYSGCSVGMVLVNKSLAPR